MQKKIQMVLLFAFMAVFNPFGQIVNAQTLIPDSGLESAIRDALGKPTGDITAADMESLTSLSAFSAGIADLTGLESAVNLTRLSLHTNQLSDISALSGLTSLTLLELSINQISDISALSGLTSLKFLGIFTNQINDISALSGLTSLIWLELHTNQISDISALSGLTSLTSLSLFRNQIRDISALAGLINLQDHFFSIGNNAGLKLQNNFIDVTPGSSQRQIIDALDAIDGLTVEFEPQNLDIFQGQPIDGFPGWKASSWYLNYNVDFWPWIYHDEHGWQFVDSGSTEEVIFVWDFGLGEWLFLNQSTYRWQFLFSDTPGWIWTFDDNTPTRRFFQRLDDGSLFSIPSGL